MKRAELYYGSPVTITGRIKQITEAKLKDGFVTDAFIYLDRWGKEPVQAYGAYQTPFVEGDRVTVIGYLAKHLHSYTSIAQWDMSIPLVIARTMMHPKDAVLAKLAGPDASNAFPTNPEAYAKLFQQRVNSEALKRPGESRADIIVSMLERMRSGIAEYIRKHHKGGDKVGMILAELEREAAEKKGAEMLASLNR
jgi:hypothetical protein